MKFFYKYIILTLISTLLFNSCTVMRSIVYNEPAVGDRRLFCTTDFAASSRPWIMERRIVQSQQLSPRFMDSTHTLAYLVVKDGVIVGESYAAGFGADTETDLFSISKSVVSLLLGIAIHDGRIGSIHDKLGKYLVDLHPQLANVSLVDLLDMCSGIKNDFWLKTYHYYGYNLEKSARKAQIISEDHGRFQYSDCSTQLLAMVLEAVTQQPLTHYFKEKLWEPLRMENHGSWTLDSRRYKNPRAFCGLNMTAHDVAKIGMLCLNDGMHEGRQIVPRRWIIETTQLRHRQPTDIDGHYYNNHWRVASSETFYAKGLFGQYLFVDKVHNRVIVRLGTSEGGINWINYFTASHHDV